MKHDLTTGTWQDGTGCPISIILAATTSDVRGQSQASWTQVASAPHPVETHCEAVALRGDPLLRVDDEGWVPWLSPDQAANPVPVAIECEPTPLIPEVGHIPEHEVVVQLVETISGIKES